MTLSRNETTLNGGSLAEHWQRQSVNEHLRLLRRPRSFCNRVGKQPSKWARTLKGSQLDLALRLALQLPLYLPVGLDVEQAVRLLDSAWREQDGTARRQPGGR
jgi:hypothetical protein